MYKRLYVAIEIFYLYECVLSFARCLHAIKRKQKFQERIAALYIKEYK